MRPILDDGHLGEAVRTWLQDELSLFEYRRVLRESGSTIVISKFDQGFSQELFSTVEGLPELFDDELVAAEYRRLAAIHRARHEAPLRSQVWREASESILDRLCLERGIDDRRRQFVLAGLESVQAFLDALMWSAPTIATDYQPSPGEAAAYEEFEAGQAERDPFVRFYGRFDGRRVESYCPGAQLARRLVAQAWCVCGLPAS